MIKVRSSYCRLHLQKKAQDLYIPLCYCTKPIATAKLIRPESLPGNVEDASLNAKLPVMLDVGWKECDVEISFVDCGKLALMVFPKP
jgi:hypothetical protein